jgi:hypothetical protein
MSISEIKMGRVAIVYGLQNMHRPEINGAGANPHLYSAVILYREHVK